MRNSTFSGNNFETTEKFFQNIFFEENSYSEKCAVVYRLGFNGKRKDDEMHNNSGDSYDFGARIYDARLARWMSVDPSADSLSEYSPYIFVLDNPLNLLDPDGKKGIPAKDFTVVIPTLPPITTSNAQVVQMTTVGLNNYALIQNQMRQYLNTAQQKGGDYSKSRAATINERLREITKASRIQAHWKTQITGLTQGDVITQVITYANGTTSTKTTVAGVGGNTIDANGAINLDLNLRASENQRKGGSKRGRAVSVTTTVTKASPNNANTISISNTFVLTGRVEGIQK